MTRFNKTVEHTPTQPGSTMGQGPNHAGGTGFIRDQRRELIQLAVTNMVSQDTFYESGKDRDNRFAGLIHDVAKDDPAWMLNFLGWLRNGANMRTASLVGAAEAVKARLDWYQDPAMAMYRFPKEVWNRRFIETVCQRADEPAELMAYWHSKYGKRLPKPVKRGLADAVARLYTERNYLKYNGSGNAIQMADVIELTHPEPDPSKLWQGDLFKYMIDKRHSRANGIPDSLKMITRNALLRSEGEIEAWLDPEILRQAGMTWEDALSAVGSKAEKRKVWEAIIPSMGAMALVRNLRNFDDAGVSDDVALKYVMPKLMNEQDIRASKMFPYRMLSAERSLSTRRWSHALDVALTHACKNVPKLDGRTMVLVDTSASMRNLVSARSKVRHIDIGALFALALAIAGNEVDLYGFADGHFKHEFDKNRSVLEQTEKFVGRVGEVGHGTETVRAISNIYNQVGRDHYKRVVIITDMQAFAYGGVSNTWNRWNQTSWALPEPGTVSGAVPLNVPLFGVDTSGYQKSGIDVSQPNRYEIGGFSDAMFTMMDLLASGKADAGWPWEVRKS